MNKLDFIGGKINLYHNGSTSIKTNFGAVISLLLTIILVITIFAFGRDFFKRTNPKVNISTTSPEHYPLYTLYNKNFSFAFRFEDWDGKQIIQDDSYYIDAMYTINVLDKNGVWQDKVYPKTPSSKMH